MRVVFAGTPEVALPSLAALVASSHEVVGVISRPDAPVGRSKRPLPSPVSTWALDHDVPLLRPEKPSGPEFEAALRDLAPDVCPVVAYGALVPAAVLAIPAQGWVNVHFSLLPAYRGAAPVQRAILAGDEVTGISIFRLVPALDAGPVYRAEATPLAPDETSGEVLDRLAVRGAQLLVDVLDALEAGRGQATEQPLTGISLAPKLTVADARIDWTTSAVGIGRLVRGCNPAPGAWTMLGGERFRIHRASLTVDEGLAPGAFRAERRRVLVGTGAGSVVLEQVQPAGRKPMAGADWGRGLAQPEGRFDASPNVSSPASDGGG